MSAPRSTRRSAFFGLLALALGACLAPTIPIPPPTEPTIAGPDANGLVTLSGAAKSAQANALLFGCNETTKCVDGRFTLVAADGSWQLDPMPGKSKDTFLVWQEIGNDRSEAVEAHVP